MNALYGRRCRGEGMVFTTTQVGRAVPIAPGQYRELLTRRHGDYYPEFKFAYSEKYGCDYVKAHNEWFRSEDGRIAYLGRDPEENAYFAFIDIFGKYPDFYAGHNIMGSDENGKYQNSVGEIGKKRALRVIDTFIKENERLLNLAFVRVTDDIYWH